MASTGEYGIVANVYEPDSCFRMGAKAWLAGGTGGEGWHRFQWIAITRGGRRVEKWTPTWRFKNFRCAWVPEHLRDAVYYIRGHRPEIEKIAADMEVFAEELRRDHPDRQFQRHEN